MQKIKFPNGGCTLVDDEDYDVIKQFTWRKKWNPYTNSYYAATGVKTILLHRLIMNAKKGQKVDHRNHDTLDNRKDNLRKVTHSQNMQNRIGATALSSTGIRGVSITSSSTSPYRATVYLHGVIVFQKRFRTIEEASKAVTEARLKYHTHSDGR